MSIVKDGIIGHAIGDAMGVPIEFESRENLLKKPVTKMIGFGAHDVPKGTWSDDTSMEIATMDSIITKKEIDYEDIMTNFYYWLRDAKYTPHGIVFDAGHTCIQAIINFSKGYKWEECGENTISSNGNGSLMRMLPITYYCYYKKLNEKEIYQIVKNISSLTHAHQVSVLGCYIYVSYVINLLNGKDKFESYKEIQKKDYSMFHEEFLGMYKMILEDDIRKYNIDDIKSSGYIVDTLEASLWVVLKTKNFKETIIGAVNLGEDTDTVGAVAGSMAGIIYGYDSIPKEWLDTLVKREYLEELCDEFEKVLKGNIR